MATETREHVTKAVCDQIETELKLKGFHKISYVGELRQGEYRITRHGTSEVAGGQELYDIEWVI